MATWQRRLVDLSYELLACNDTYFEPDHFRRNLNHYLQTARTVTFLIQKQKSQIPDFEAWYSANVLEPWSKEPVMNWAKNSRNTVEKEGDLEMRSTLVLRLITSYLEETDTQLSIGREELFHGGVKKLRRFAEKQLPTSVFNSSAIRLERAWIANSFPDMELLALLSKVYSHIYNCCLALCKHLNTILPAETPPPAEVNFELHQGARIAYVKLRDRSVSIVRAESQAFDKGIASPPELERMLAGLPKAACETPTLESRMDFLSLITERIFQAYQNHGSFLFVFRDHWRSMRTIAMHPSDRVEKYIFWRSVADMISPEKLDAVVFVAEIWFREAQPNVFVEDMPIKGDGILMTGLSRTGELRQITWSIDRSGQSPRLSGREMREVDRRSEAVNFLVPLMRAFGLTDSKVG